MGTLFSHNIAEATLPVHNYIFFMLVDDEQGANFALNTLNNIHQELILSL